ncbi:hypothetical protein PspS35_13730 [Pseudomonas sp. S35]|uniref:hypothetical protein n=1 Tax=Pseudomonas sp. S35 TaxID=1573719 RepID=UPI00132EAA61|nr:hypothetical protein [Pseudomonas sp. S35]QHF44786.1 hypothetical protein PspS35_13730 [Pseudomonas sp. S35]
MEHLPSGARKILRDGLRAFDKSLWDLISYSRDSDVLKYDPGFLTTNEGLHLRARKYLDELKDTLSKNHVSHPYFEKAFECGLHNVNKIKVGQSRSHLRWHLNNARCELINEMTKDRTNVRIEIAYLHPHM